MEKQNIPSPILDETLPHQIHFPSFKGTGMMMEEPFINDYGVVIGDSLYNSENSPLNHWSDEVPPEIMAGEQWVHPTNDIGWTSGENQELLAELRGTREPENGQETDIFMHPQYGIND